MKDKKYRLVIHPYLFALYIVLAPLVNNITEVRLSGLRAMFFSLLGAFVVMIVTRLVFKDALKAGLLTSGVIVMAFYYGHVENLAKNWKVGGVVIGQPAILAPLWLLLFSAWVYLVLKRWQDLVPMTRYLNWVSVFLNLFPIFTLLLFNYQSSGVKPLIQPYIEQTWQQSGVADIRANPDKFDGEKLPDIYYIILDAYTRADVLAELYQYDNAPFINALRERGFYVADASWANYTDTVLSLASSMNMTHINTIPAHFYQQTGVDNYWVIKDVCSSMLRQSRVARTLQDQGYTFVSFATGYKFTGVTGADQYVGSPEIEDASGSELVFEMMLLDTSLGRLYMRLRGDEFAPLQSLFTAHRQRIQFTLEKLPSFAKMDGNYFVFAHVVSPHAPYVFGPNGEELTGVDPYTLLDAHPGAEANIALYSGQVNYLNKLVLQAIDQILANSDVPPIIILQGDHSSRVYRTLDQSRELKLTLLHPILNAYHLPGSGSDQLYPGITPVNSFRVILNSYFNANLELLEDAGYQLDRVGGHNEYVDVCKAYGYCLP